MLKYWGNKIYIIVLIIIVIGTIISLKTESYLDVNLDFCNDVEVISNYCKIVQKKTAGIKSKDKYLKINVINDYYLLANTHLPWDSELDFNDKVIIIKIKSCVYPILSYDKYLHYMVKNYEFKNNNTFLSYPIIKIDSCSGNKNWKYLIVKDPW